MIAVAGGTGRLGTRVVELLAARGLNVRVLTRDLARGQRIAGPLVECVQCDIHDRQTVQRALIGATTVISAIQGFSGTGDDSPRSVDWLGNQALIDCARQVGAERFVLTSVYGAAADHPMELFRMKYQAEQHLLSSGLAWTIVQPTAYMETWAELIGAPLLRTGSTRIFGHGTNPINFVSVADVARVIEHAATDSSVDSTILSVCGPENLSMHQFVEPFARAAGIHGKIRHVPLPIMRVMATVMRPIHPTLARQIQAGVVMDTWDMTGNPAEMGGDDPTYLVEVIQRDYLEGKRVQTTDPAFSVT